MCFGGKKLSKVKVKRAFSRCKLKVSCFKGNSKTKMTAASESSEIVWNRRRPVPIAFSIGVLCTVGGGEEPSFAAAMSVTEKWTSQWKQFHWKEGSTWEFTEVTPRWGVFCCKFSFNRVYASLDAIFLLVRWTVKSSDKIFRLRDRKSEIATLCILTHQRSWNHRWREIRVLRLSSLCSASRHHTDRLSRPTRSPRALASCRVLENSRTADL